MLTDLETTGAALLARASKLLASSLDYQTTVQNIARAGLPDFADWCIVDLLGERASIHRVAAAHVDPAVDTECGRRAQTFGPDLGGSEGAAKVMRSGRAELFCASNEPLAGEFGGTSMIVAPLVVSDRVLGALSFGSTAEYSSANLPLAEELANRCAQALDNALRYQLACESIRLRDTFVATIAHDLKNPLATIGAQAQLMRRVTASEAPNAPAVARLRTGVHRIENTVERMSRMIDGLLDVTRLELGEQLELRRAPMDIVDVARRVIAEHQERAPLHSIQLAGETGLVGNWDMARIERALDNLIGNAVKYSPDGGIITVICVRDGDDADASAIVSVRDHGVGIPAGDVERVFERFHRAGNVGTVSGTGIGLALVREVIDRHGGTITVDSTQGVGTTFTIRLPLE